MHAKKPRITKLTIGEHMEETVIKFSYKIRVLN